MVFFGVELRSAPCGAQAAFLGPLATGGFIYQAKGGPIFEYIKKPHGQQCGMGEFGQGKGSRVFYQALGAAGARVPVDRLF